MEQFGGWLRPLLYRRDGESEAQAVTREVLNVRGNVGILDYSPLAKFDIRGPDAAEFLNRLYVSNVHTLKVGAARYGLVLSDHGDIVDDGVFCRPAEDHFWVTTTSGGAEHRTRWFEEWRQCEWPDLDVIVTPVTTGWGTVSIQGPKARDLICRLDSDIDFSRDAFAHMQVRFGHVSGVPARVLRASFTGEVGFELSVPVSYTAALWELLVEQGTDLSLQPFGVEALMVMRTEKGYIHVGKLLVQKTPNTPARFFATAEAALGLALPPTPGRFVRSDDDRMAAVWLSPLEWLITVPAGQETAVQTVLADAFAGLVAWATDVTDRNVQIALSGPQARTLLAKGCPLDLSPDAFEPGQSARSLLGHAPVVIQLAAPTPDFRLTFDASLAPYLWLWLEAAMQEESL